MEKAFKDFSSLELIEYIIFITDSAPDKRGTSQGRFSVLKKLLKDNTPEEAEEFFQEVYNRFIKGDSHSYHSTRDKYLNDIFKESYDEIMEKTSYLTFGIETNKNTICAAFSTVIVEFKSFVDIYQDVFIKKYYNADPSSYVTNDNLIYLKMLSTKRLVNLKSFSEFVCNKLIDKTLEKDFKDKSIKELLTIAGYGYEFVDKDIIKKISPKVIRKYNLEIEIFPLDIETFAEDMLICKKGRLKSDALDYLHRGDIRLAKLANNDDRSIMAPLIHKIPWQFLPAIASRLKNDVYMLSLIERRFEEEELFNSIRRQ
jgi:hypothetical protein